MTQLLFTHVHSLKTLFIENKRNASAMKGCSELIYKYYQQQQKIRRFLTNEKKK